MDNFYVNLMINIQSCHQTDQQNGCWKDQKNYKSSIKPSFNILHLSPKQCVKYSHFSSTE